MLLKERVKTDLNGRGKLIKSPEVELDLTDDSNCIMNSQQVPFPVSNKTPLTHGNCIALEMKVYKRSKLRATLGI